MKHYKLVCLLLSLAALTCAAFANAEDKPLSIAAPGGRFIDALEKLEARIAKLEQDASKPRLVFVAQGHFDSGKLKAHSGSYVANSFVWGGKWHIKVFRLEDEKGQEEFTLENVSTPAADIVLCTFNPAEPTRIYWKAYKIQ